MDIATPALQVYPDRRLSEFTAPAGDVLAATIGQAFHDLPVAEINRSTDRYLAEHGQPTRAGTYMFRPGTATTLLSTEDAQAKIKDAGLDGQLTAPPDGMRQGSLDLLIQNRLDQNRRASIISRSPGGVVLGATNLAATLAVSLLDPVNDVMGFMPVVGEARYAKMLASAGGSVVGRTAVRAGVGAVEGAAGMAALQPLQLASAKIDQDQYGINDALANILYGGVFGAVLHNIGPAIEGGYRLSRGRPLIEKQAAAAEAISALLEDRPPRVGEMLESMRREKLLGSTSAARPPEPSGLASISEATGRPTDPLVGRKIIHVESEKIFTIDGVSPDGKRVYLKDGTGTTITLRKDDLARKLEMPVAPWRHADEGVAPAGGGERTFTTAKGSSYILHEDGTTTRTKAARDTPGHEGDSGLKPRTAKTVYVEDGKAALLSGAGLHGLGEHGARLAIRDGKASFLTWNKTADKWGVAPGQRDIPIFNEPAVGRQPLELWDKKTDVPGYDAYANQHAGNEITELRAPPATPPAPFDAQAALAGATRPPSLMDTLTQIRNDRVNLSPRDAAAIAAVKTAAKGYDAPTTDGGLAELTGYATDTNDALAVAAQAETLSPEELAHVQEADEMVSNSEKIANGLKAAAQCVARAL